MTAPDFPRALPENFEPSAVQWGPNKWTAESGMALVAAMSAVFHPRRHERMAHRDGVVRRAVFSPSGTAVELSDFSGFRGPDDIPAFVRFSGLLRELHQPRDIKGMAVKLVLPDGELTDLLAMTLPVFPVRRSRDFVALLDAAAVGGIRLVVRLIGLIASRRVRARALWAALRARFRRTDYRWATYHSVQTFRLVRARRDGRQEERLAVRYRWVPLPGPRPPDGTLHFRLELVLGDVRWPRVDDASFRWPRRAPTVPAGVLVVTDEITPEPRDLAFNPAVLAPGIEMGDDDLSSGRAGAYPLAHLRRYDPESGG